MPEISPGRHNDLFHAGTPLRYTDTEGIRHNFPQKAAGPRLDDVNALREPQETEASQFGVTGRKDGPFQSNQFPTESKFGKIAKPSRTPPHSEDRMADTPDKITFGIGQGFTRKMVRLADGSYADTVAPAYGSGLVTDSTGEFTFDISSLPSKYKYDGDRNMTSATYGPNPSGKFIRQTSVWVDGLLDSESAWFLVDGLEVP